MGKYQPSLLNQIILLYSPPAQHHSFLYGRTFLPFFSLLTHHSLISDLLMTERDLQRAFVHRYIWSAMTSAKARYQFCRRTLNCPSPSAQGSSSGRRQFARASFIFTQSKLCLPLIMEEFRCTFPRSRNYPLFSTPRASLILIRIT